MNSFLRDVLEIVERLGLGAGALIAACTYTYQVRTRRSEWLESLYEKFYLSDTFRKVRRWIESGQIETKIKDNDDVTENDELFADYLNFFEFISTLESEGRLAIRDVLNLFEHYLRKIKSSVKCRSWVNNPNYGFEKLRNLLNKIEE